MYCIVQKVVRICYRVEVRRIDYRATPTTAGSTLRRDMLGSSVVKSIESSHSTIVGDTAAVSFWIGKADQRVVGLERSDYHTNNCFQNGNRVSM